MTKNAYLPKISILLRFGVEIFAWLCPDDSILERICKKTFVLIIGARFKICNIYIFENDARLVMFNVASIFLAKKKTSLQGIR